MVAAWLPSGTCGDWEIRRAVVSPGVCGAFPVGTYTELYRNLPDGGTQRVMMDEPAEIAEHRRFYDVAHGRVLITGLGLGMIAAWVAAKPVVHSVTVIEKNADVIALVAPHFPPAIAAKIRILQADAYEWIQDGDYDAIWHDCWYIVPEQVEMLLARYSAPIQDYWEPGITAR